LVKKKCIELIPICAKNISLYFTDTHLNQGIKSIFAYINKKDNAFKGQGFLSLGKMSLMIPKAKFMNFIPEIFSLIEKEI